MYFEQAIFKKYYLQHFDCFKFANDYQVQYFKQSRNHFQVPLNLHLIGRYRNLQGGWPEINSKAHNFL